MDRLRHQFLAAAGFALDQHRRRRAGEQHDRLPHALHRLGVAAQVVEAVFRAQRIGHRRRPPAYRFQLGQARQFQRIVEGLADRGRRIDEDAGQPGFLRQVGDQAGADDGLDAGRLQLVDLGARIFFGDIGALGDLEAEGGLELGQFRQRLLVGDDADAPA